MQRSLATSRFGIQPRRQFRALRVPRCSMAVGVAVAILIAATAEAQQGPPSTSDQQLAEIVVTGSLIKRTDTETPSPVQIITALDLQNSGYTNVSDVLRTLSANGAGTLNQGFGQAFASGGSGIALRGLTVGDTLTLIDGQRMVAYPLSDDGERSFVDVSAIPINAIETIEVLKDGASAAYGADAIAGVVNIKLKQSYVGSEFTVEAGSTQHGDGTNEHAAGIWGMGDLASDGYNVYAAIDWHHTDEILGSNRSGTWTNLDWSGLPGGVNTTPGAIGSGNLVYPDSATGYLLNPGVTPANAGQPAQAFLPGCTPALQAANQCTFAFPGLIQPSTEQLNFLTKFTKALASDWTVSVTASLFNSKAEQVAPPTEPAFGHLLNNTGAEQGSIPLLAWGPGIPQSVNVYPALSLPASSALNPYGAAATLVYSFPDVGPWVVDTNTDTYRLFGDLKGKAAGWDLDANVGVMYAKMTERFSGELNPTLAQAALNDGSYVPGSSTNNVSLIAPLTYSSPSSTLDLIDVHASRELFQMPGGPLGIAIGAQYFHKAQNDQDPPTVALGLQEGITNFTVGSQDDTSGFVEFGGKPITPLEVNAAVRYDHYDTYGGQATPKAGFKFTPVPMVSVRGTWGKGFRAPSISESGNSGIAFGEGNGADPVLCANGPNVKGSYNALCSYPIVGVEPPNPSLKAVTSTNATFGVIFEPFKEFNVSVDWYRIVLNNDIISSSSAGGLSNYVSIVRGAQVVLPVCTNTPTNGAQCATANVLTPVGYPTFSNYPYLNAGITKTSGIDIDLRSRIDLGIAGTLTGTLNYTYISQYEIEVAGVTYDLDGTHGPTSVSGDTGNPKQRAVASVTWEKGPASATVNVNYTGAFKVTDPSAGYNTCQAALAGSGDSYGAALSGSVTTLASAWYPYCTVHHFTDVNLVARYAITDHVSMHGSITNLFDTPPPVDLQTYGGGAAYRYSTLDQDGAVGRFFLLGVTVKF
jgi:iron complex outermembrane recepter protein